MEKTGWRMKTGQKQHNGFSLRVFNLLMVVAAVAMTVIMVCRLASSFLRLEEATKSHITMEKAATGLMDASDFLTEETLDSFM